MRTRPKSIAAKSSCRLHACKRAASRRRSDRRGAHSAKVKVMHAFAQNEQRGCCLPPVGAARPLRWACRALATRAVGTAPRRPLAQVLHPGNRTPATASAARLPSRASRRPRTRWATQSTHPRRGRSPVRAPPASADRRAPKNSVLSRCQGIYDAKRRPDKNTYGDITCHPLRDSGADQQSPRDWLPQIGAHRRCVPPSDGPASTAPPPG